MNKPGLLALLCVFGAAACSHLREPTDAQLATLLRSERAAPTDASALLDGRAIECLRAWSGDKELLKGLPVRVAGEDGQKECRGNLDGWIADASRNPDKFSFADVSAPKVVRRAMTLEEARRVAAAADPARHQIPAALGRTSALSAPKPLATPDPAVDLGAAGARLAEAEALCLQAQKAAATPEHKQMKRFADYCSGNLRNLRTSMEQSARSGQGPERLDQMAASADNIANVARNALAEGSQ